MKKLPEEYTLNELLSQLPSSFDNIWLTRSFSLLDKTGRILKIWNRKINVLCEPFSGYFKENENIFKLFDDQGARDLDDLYSRSPSIIISTRPDIRQWKYLSYENIYSDLPYATLRVVKIMDDLFLGVIFPNRFLPNTFSIGSTTSLVLIDNKDRIRGFDDSFHREIRPFFPNTQDVLSKPADLVLTPTPRKIQEDYFQWASGQKTDDYKSVFSYKNGLKEQLIHETPGSVEHFQGNIKWRSSGYDNDVIILPGVLNTVTRDFRFEVSFSVNKGNGPLLQLRGISAPDTPVEYLVGESYSREGYLLKRNGLAVDFREIKIEKEVSVTFLLEKTGRAFVFSVDGKTVLKYFDSSFLSCPNAGLQLELRPGSDIVLHSFELQERKTLDENISSAQKEVTVEFVGKPGKYFTLARLLMTHEASFQNDISGYLLTDVTYFQEKAEYFKKAYQREQQKGERLESILQLSHRETLIGQSESICNIKEMAMTAAESSVQILIQGPTGTGKEVLANFIHQNSPRKNGPFIKVDCSVLPETLIESELFGHEKGAFTGSVGRKIGRFEQADKGTLFLDEIGNLEIAMQAKLLNVLQDHAITRVGGQETISLDVRIIAASNIDLDLLQKKGAFRDDLLYRLNTVTLDLPALSDRLEDIPLLCGHFISQFNKSLGRNIRDLTPEAYQRLYSYSWPGNIRELRNIIHRAVVFCKGEWIDKHLIQIKAEAPKAQLQKIIQPSRKSRSPVQRDQFIAVARKHRGNVMRIASELGVSRALCYLNLKKFGIEIAQFREGK